MPGIAFILCNNNKQQQQQPTNQPLFQIREASAACAYDTVVFAGPPLTEQTLWPRHCVQQTWGAELHKDLKVDYRGTVATASAYTILANMPEESAKNSCNVPNIVSFKDF
jgi:nicotinamidase-related amidase